MTAAMAKEAAAAESDDDDDNGATQASYLVARLL